MRLLTHKHTLLTVSSVMASWNPKDFQDALNSFLSRRGWSQPELARASGISQAVVNRWLSVDPQMLVQPTDASLRKLSPVIGIPHTELMRLAGRLDGAAVKSDKPEELVNLLRDVEAGYWSIDEHERPVRMDVARSAMNPGHARRPSNRRNKGNNAGLDRHMKEYLTHK